MKKFMAVVAFSVTIWTFVTGKEGVTQVVAELPRRNLRQKGAWMAIAPVLAGVTQSSTNPLQRRDKALVAAHRVYDPASGLTCALVGTCIACLESEIDESFCRETGYRQELECPVPRDSTDKVVLSKSDDERQKRFTACRPPDVNRAGLAVIKFEVVMTMLLTVSVILLRRERGNHMSLFDRRKEPCQRDGLLGGPLSSDKGFD